MTSNVPYDPEGEKLRLKTMLREGFMPSADGRVIRVSKEVADSVIQQIEADSQSDHQVHDDHGHDDGQGYEDLGI